jgi:zinc finger CCCH domain-containing protein 13
VDFSQSTSKLFSSWRDDENRKRKANYMNKSGHGGAEQLERRSQYREGGRERNGHGYVFDDDELREHGQWHEPLKDERHHDDSLDGQRGRDQDGRHNRPPWADYERDDRKRKHDADREREGDKRRYDGDRYRDRDRGYSDRHHDHNRHR